MEGEVLLILECSEPEPVEFNIENLAVSVVQETPIGSLVLAGSGYINHEISGRQLVVSSGSFFQVNTLQAQAMVTHLLQHLPLDPSHTILDVYCGVGLFSTFLAPRVKAVVGIELSAQACEDFTINLDEYDNVSLYEAAAEDVLAGINFRPDVMIVDPPREGLGARTVDGLLAQAAPHLAYISCDPATLARDTKRLSAGGYELKELALIDMFPQTYHIESISYWEKK
jgi:23S rRNA (uracil1939-C5)-methyltransferase